jgi:hypothetical protein
VGYGLLGRPTRRRLSRRRLFWRSVWCIVVGVIVVVGCVPSLRYLGYIAPRLGKSEVTTQWEVATVAPDRRSVVLRVDVCTAHFDRVRVTRVGKDVRLTVYVRHEHGARPKSCPTLSSMPKRVVQLGFALPAGAHILGAG